MWNPLFASCKRHPARSILAGALLLVMLALASADALLAGPVRAWAERTINASLDGYTVRIARARPRIWRLALILDGVVVTQNRHPLPPVADLGALEFTLQWSQLLHLKVAGNLTIQRPALHLNLAQIQEGAHSRVSMKDQGWQRAVESIYPIKLDQVELRKGSLLYLAAGAEQPLQLTQVNMVARNIRNSAATHGTYPSPVTLEGALFDTGRLRFKGAADFLREPYAAAQGEIQLERVPLDRLGPLAQDYQLKTTGGLLSLRGSLEYSPQVQEAHMTEVLFEDLRVDYVTSPATRPMERAHARQARQMAKEVRNAPKLKLQVDSLKLRGSQIGFVNRAAQPPYRLFMTDVSLQLDHLGNHPDPHRSGFQAQGAFMGSGRTVISGDFRAAAQPADGSIQLHLDDARLTELNPFLLASTGVDVADGLFSVYTELRVKDGRVEGYLKPLIKHLRISDPRKDRGKSFGKRMEMHLLQGLASLFKNSSTGQVATVIRISGSTRDPRMSEWEAIRKLVGNGLFQAIRPGFLGHPEPGKADPPGPARQGIQTRQSR